MATSTIRNTVGRSGARVQTTTTLSELMRMTLPGGFKLVMAYMNFNASAPKQLRLYDTQYGLPISDLVSNSNGAQASMTAVGVTQATSVALYGSSVGGGENLVSISYVKL